jgi:phytoene desaturase
VEKIQVYKGKAFGIKVNGAAIAADVVLSGADYHFTETLLEETYRQYSEKYWDKKTFAPSSLLFYVGFDKKIENVNHHTLFFDAAFEQHAVEIYDTKVWPKNPLFYASFPSKTDASFAPNTAEAATFLIPLAIDLEDTPEIREQYFDMIIDRFEKLTNQSVREHIVIKESFCVNDFKSEYNSYKGNAYGLANILTQTAFLRPKIKSKKVSNLYFTGQLTVPGPGVPPALISGKIASDKIINEIKL